MANGLLDLLMQARESGRGARADLENSINYYIPPELRGLLGFAAEANPVVSMERAGQDAQRLVQPGLSGWERMAAAGDMASNMASVLAPMAAGRAVGMPAVRAAQEGLLGLSMTPEAAALRQFGGAVDPMYPYGRAAVRPDDVFRGSGVPRITVDVSTQPYVVRKTGLDQVKDMVQSGMVRPKPGGYGKGGYPQIYFGESASPGPSIFTRIDPQSVRIVGDSPRLAGREGPIPIDELKHVFALRDGQEVDILEEILRRNQSWSR